MKFIFDHFQKIRRRAAAPEFLFYFVAVWTGFILLSTLPLGDLSGYDDAAYAHEAKTILQTNDWWTLHLNGVPDFDKPPLFIWLLAASFKLFGANDFAAKLPVALLGWATVIAVYFLTKELFADEDENGFARKWLPVLAMLVMATTQYFLKYASHAMTDVPFTFFFTLAVYFYVRALKNRKFLPACGIAAGLAMLMRAPMGFFPLGIVVLHSILTRRAKSLFSIYFTGGVLLAVLIPAIWYWREYQIFGDVFLKLHFANFLAHSAAPSALAARSAWQQILWYFEYVFLLVKLYIPWFPLMFYGLFLVVRRAFSAGKTASAEILLVVWVAVVVIPFSAADSKVLRYILPAFPAFAILAAVGLRQILASKNRLPKFSQLAVALLTVAALAAVIFPNYLARGEDMRQLAPISDAATAPDEKILLYTSGEYQWNYLNQLLWYGNRLCRHSKDLSEIETALAVEKTTTVIMDKSSFEVLPEKAKNRALILGESKNFVCFRRNL